ncbi:MAG: glycine/sarcosine/betaine reductase selenoprotein B family protein [Actinomycetota bacterium]
MSTTTDSPAETLRDGRSPLPPADYIAETRSLYDSLGYEAYRWAERTDPAPWVDIGKPLSACTVAVIGSGGVYRHGQVAFHTKDDTSVRVLPSYTPTSALRTAHFAYDQADARSDINCVLPLDRLGELAADGVIGGVAAETYTFMGGIYSVRRLETEVVPRLVERCVALRPDIVLLVPV